MNDQAVSGTEVTAERGAREEARGTTGDASQTGPPAGGLAGRSGPFLRYLDAFVAGMADVQLAEVIAEAGGPGRVAIVAVDVVNGFCTAGALASERVGAIVGPVARLLAAAGDAGVEAIAVLRDDHHPNAPEFEHFAPHCLVNSVEAALVDEVAGLPGAATFADVPKNAISAWHGADAFSTWVDRQEASGVSVFVVVGDCTDLCVYQTAMPLRLRANTQNRPIRVIVPAECVDTYDLPVDAAGGIGAMPHDGDLLHAVFLYHLQLNGIQVVRRLLAPSE